MDGSKNWIVFQIGAREHYALAEGFDERGALSALVTDFWSGGSHWSGRLFRNLGLGSLLLRKNNALSGSSSRIVAFNRGLILFELKARLKGLKGWELIYQRNRWFAAKAARWLNDHLKRTGNRPVVFSYSYTALEIFNVAKKYGCVTVLGQIDGAMAEEDIVRAEVLRYPDFNETFTGVPGKYWEKWKEEIGFSDHVIVNSHWSHELALKNGVPAGKLRVIPLAYEKEPVAGYQQEDRKGKLCVLYLGTLTLRKGLARLLEAAEILSMDEPEIIFTIAGGGDISIPEKYRSLSNIKFIGKVERNKVDELYQSHDVFLFPTLSDGFGLTQLEALANCCHIVVSRNCAAVVENGSMVGTLLDMNTPEEIARVLSGLKQDASLRPRVLAAGKALAPFSLEKVIGQYFEL